VGRDAHQFSSRSSCSNLVPLDWISLFPTRQCQRERLIQACPWSIRRADTRSMWRDQLSTSGPPVQVRVDGLGHKGRNRMYCTGHRGTEGTEVQGYRGTGHRGKEAKRHRTQGTGRRHKESRIAFGDSGRDDTKASTWCLSYKLLLALNGAGSLHCTEERRQTRGEGSTALPQPFDSATRQSLTST